MSDPRLAIALRYLSGLDEAPRVVARGRGELAIRILELARESGVPVRADADLAEALSVIEVGKSIPPEMYQALAEVLAWLLGVNGSLKA